MTAAVGELVTLTIQGESHTPRALTSSWVCSFSSNPWALLSVLSHAGSLAKERCHELVIEENPFSRLEKSMATLSSILAWRTPWTRSLVGYNTQGHRVGCD